MEVKTFEAISVKDAIKAVKAEFGSDAIILRTKEKVFENNKIYEVTAAAAKSQRTLGASSNYEKDRSLENVSVNDERLEALEIKVNTLAESMARKNQLQTIESGLEELKLLVMESLRNKQGSLLKGLSKPLADLANQLNIMGVDAAQVSQLMKFLQDLPNKLDKDSSGLQESEAEFYRGNAIRWMLKRIKLAPRWQPVKGQMSVQAFVGPSGSGKTSMIAKVAANLSKQHKEKIVIVSFDPIRLAANEQSRIYSKVLGLTFESIDRAEEMNAIIAKHKDASLILVDTAGRSPKNQHKFADLKALNDLTLPVEFHLVLSVTDKLQQLDRCVRSFAQLNISSLCFSKLDESWSYGEIFNLSSKWSLPLSYFSVGQGIPEDIERASKERVIERIFAL